MREAADRDFECEEARASFRRDAMAASAHHQETGLHMTGDELAVWLDSWGTDLETDPPMPHE